MEIKGVKEFIPRDIDPGAAPSLIFIGETIDYFIDFGSNIFKWEDYSQSGEEDIAPTMLLRHFLDVLDSISILIKQSCPDPAKLLLRGALETHFSLGYLLAEDTYNRSMAFFVEDILTEIEIIEKMIQMRDSQGSGAHRRFKVKDEESTLEDVLKGKKKILQLPKFKPIFEEFEKTKGKSKYNPHWYQCFKGPKTIREIAKRMGEGDLYDNIYSVYSRNTHGTDVIGGKLETANENQVDIIQIRRPTDAQQVARFTLFLANTTIRKYVEKRLAAKLHVYNEWFKAIVDRVNRIMSQVPFF